MTAPLQPSPDRSSLHDLLWIGIAAGAVRAVYLWQIRSSPLFDYLHLDPLYYLEWGRRIAGGEWVGSAAFEQSPLYPYGLGLFLGLFGERLLLLRLLQLSLGVLACLGIARIARHAFDQRTALVAGMLAALYAPFPFYEGQVMKSYLNYLLVTGALLCLYRSGGQRRGWLAACGACLGLLALVRANSLLLALALAAWVIGSRGLPGWKRRLAPAAALLAGTAAVLAPATLHNAAASGELVLITSGGGEVFYIGNWSGANGAYLPPPFVRPAPAFEHEDFRAEARRRTGSQLSRGDSSRFWFRSGMQEAIADPARWIRLELRKLAIFWNARELPDNYSFALFARAAPILRALPGFGVLAPLALVGMALAWKRRRELMPLHLVWIIHMLGVLAFFNFSRFRLPAIPALIPFAAVALLAAFDSLRGRSYRRAVAIAAAAVALALPIHLDLTSPSDAPGQDQMLEGWALLAASRPAEAEAAFSEARSRIEAFHRDGGTAGLELGSACYGLGSARLQLGRAEAALEPLRRAAELDPRSPGPLSKLVTALGAAGRPAEAEATLQTLTRLEPERFAHWFDLATVSFQRGDAAEALRRFEAGREHGTPLGPLDLADYHLGVALVELQLRGDRAAALPHLRRVLELAPAHAQAAAIQELLAGD